MLVRPPIEEDLKLSMFIDFDKQKEKFYNNIYIENFRVVVKMPFIQREDPKENINIDRFDLNNYIYICDYR
ncbi:MAG: hypothetical protein P8Y97_14380 [Candidatus Lokiarchaeota archaeon]